MRIAWNIAAEGFTDARDGHAIREVLSLVDHEMRMFLDGIYQSRVIAIDTDKGVLMRFVTDADGKVQRHPIIRNEAWTETLNGKVHFEIVPIEKAKP